MKLLTSKKYKLITHKIELMESALKGKLSELNSVKSELVKLKFELDRVKRLNYELAQENMRLRLVNHIAGGNIDFPNSKKGGQGEPETPLNFPDISD